MFVYNGIVALPVFAYAMYIGVQEHDWTRGTFWMAAAAMMILAALYQREGNRNG